MRRLGQIAVLISLLAMGAGCNRSQAPMAGGKGESHQPVSVVVLDETTGKPIPDFCYQYWIDAPGQGARNSCDCDTWQVAKTSDGTFTIDAPLSCSIRLAIQADDYPEGHGFPGGCNYIIRTDDAERRIIVRLERGLVVRGKVLDAATGKPLAGASVSPVIFLPPMFAADVKRAVKTDAEGRFELCGVDESLGIEAGHPDFFSQQVEVKPDGAADVKIALEAGESVHGIAHDITGKPVANVVVDNGDGKKTQTDAEGRFMLKSPSKWWDGEEGQAYPLAFSKVGYADLTVYATTVPNEWLKVTMKPVFVVIGRVVGSDGKPVKCFCVMAGPGKMPQGFETTRQSVTHAEGCFRVPVQNPYGEAIFWLAVRAAGAAPWEGTVDAKVIEREVAVHLVPGVAVTGTLASKGRDLKVVIFPVRPEADSFVAAASSPVIAGSEETVAAKDGTFCIEHVRPDRYMFYVIGKSVTPVVREIMVPSEGLDLGTISLAGTGRIVGRIEPLHGVTPSFAGGKVSIRRFAVPYAAGGTDDFSIPFTADENGRFEVVEVPVGEAEIVLPYMATADVVGAHVRKVSVAEGRTTEVTISGE